jgi:branched-chain amino acid transport system substrate-binding protein
VKLWAGLALAVLLSACGPGQPVRIGFIAALSNRSPDVEEDSRNGLILAIEQRNQAGGLGGHRVELVVRDSGQTPQQALTAMQALVQAPVVAVVGSLTSATAAVVVPVANQAQMVLVSPTVTSMDFVGKDDYFFRVNRNARQNASAYAAKLYQRGQHRVAVLYDVRNKSLSSSWVQEFRTAYQAAGGEVAAEVAFGAEGYGVADSVRQMLAGEPDGLLFIASTLDVAQLAQQAEKLAPGLPKTASEWASGDYLIELGGRAVEGMVTAQVFDRHDSSEHYRRFRDAYQARFARQPNFSAVASYDSGTVLLQALEQRSWGESLKQALLKYGPYTGLQQSIQFDRFGDATRKMYFTQIQAGQFVPLP